MLSAVFLSGPNSTNHNDRVGSLGMRDEVANFIIHNGGPAVVGITALGAVILFLIIKLFRQRKNFTGNVLGEIVRSAVSVLIFFSGLQILAVFLLKDPPAFAELSREHVVLIGIVAPLVCCFLGLFDLCKVLFVDTARPGDKGGGSG